MTHLNQLIRSIVVALFALGWAGSAAAQGAITVSANLGHVDTLRRLVLINAPLHLLRPDVDSIRSVSLDGHSFVLAHPVAKVSPARAYLASSQGRQYQLFFTRLPVLELTTRHQIADTPSVHANLRLIDSTGVPQQTATGIEWRGSTAQTYPKKSYELSLWADTLGATDQDMSLLGMRNDNKWNLQAMYNDQLRGRLKAANELWLEINQPYYQAQEPTAKTGIALAYTEVFLNGSYEGVYALTERIDRKQLQLKKYANGVIKGELYKGVDWGSADTYYGAPAYDNASTLWSGFQYQEPSEVTDWANLYGFVDFVVNSPAATFYSQYQSRFNQASAVDYFLFWNLLRATDNGGKNLYVAKYKTGEPYFFVPWDLDGVLGNDWSGANVNVTTGLLSNGFYDRLQQETGAGGFWPAAASRWASLRASVITAAHLDAKIIACHDLLLGNNVYEREQLRWPDFQYSAAQLAYQQSWTASRIAYLDGVFGYNPLAAAEPVSSAALQLYPNPASGTVYVDGLGQASELVLNDLSGRLVLQVALSGSRAQVDISRLPAGLYLARLTSDQATVTRKLLVR